jgi:hypothetical protein
MEKERASGIITDMKIDLCYVFPDLQHNTYVPLARRFVSTYMNHPPGESDHEVHVLVTNGNGRFISGYQKLFEPMICGFMMHDNIGKDIGAYQQFSESSDADLIVFCGAPVRFTRSGWMDRIVQAYIENGPALYGCWGFHQPADHIRTTAFWCPPLVLNSYPYRIGTGERYEFEHGGRSITNHTAKLGLERYMVTWEGVYPRDHWRNIDHKESLFLDQHYDRNGIP